MCFQFPVSSQLPEPVSLRYAFTILTIFTFLITFSLSITTYLGGRIGAVESLGTSWVVLSPNSVTWFVSGQGKGVGGGRGKTSDRTGQLAGSTWLRDVHVAATNSSR